MQCTDREKYFFDLNGYIILRGALSQAELTRLNNCIDELPPMSPGEWFGHVYAHHFYDDTNGVNLQQIYEAGKPFEDLIDHPSWYEKVRTFVGGEGSFDYKHGPMFIDENFVSLRGPGQNIFPHSGGHNGTQRGHYRTENGKFHCGQVNALMALTDIGLEDGPTVVIPGSHKSKFRHPDMVDRPGLSSEEVEGMVPVCLEAGDVLIFVDSISHGAWKKRTPGQRRICVYRYGPSWGNFRHGVQPSQELLDRLTDRQRQIVQPQVPIPRGPQVSRQLSGAV